MLLLESRLPSPVLTGSGSRVCGSAALSALWALPCRLDHPTAVAQPEASARVRDSVIPGVYDGWASASSTGASTAGI